MKILFGVLITLCLHSWTSGETYRSEEDVTDLMTKFAKKALAEDEEAEFNRLVKLMAFPNYVDRYSFDYYGRGRSTVACLTCRSAVNSFLNMVESGSTEEELMDFAVNICTVLQIQPYHVCRGLVDLNAPIFIYIFHNTPEFTSRSFCGVLLQTDNPNVCQISDPRYEWTVDIPAKKDTAKKPPSTKEESTIKIAHFTDAHYDPAYEAFGLAACNEATCCRIGQAEPQSRQWRAPFHEDSTDDHVWVDAGGSIHVDVDYSERLEAMKAIHSARLKRIEDEDRAGFWGDYRNCDSPWWAFEDGVDFIAENHQDVEYIYYTGDTIDHGVWETDYDMIIEGLNKTYVKMLEAFGDTPVFPGIGNHEAQPTNVFAPPSVTEPGLSTLWLYEYLSDLWSVWLPEDTKTSMSVGGYYTMLVKPGFRIVVLNTNLCYIYNWWIHLDPQDPSDQLAWLVDTLLAAEEAEEKVHILSHIPPGIRDYYAVCSREYTRIIDRFSDIIVAEFNGHTHKDEFKIFYKKETGEPYGLALNGGSLTPYSHVNYNYRIYEVDSETYDIIDAETWIYNLTEANLTPEQRPRWYKEYSFREHFGVESMRPAELDKLTQRLVTTDKDLLAVDYHRFRGKSAPRWTDGICDSRCIRSNLCYMVRTDLRDTDRCEELWETFFAEEGY